jgi:hypothetical protein
MRLPAISLSCLPLLLAVSLPAQQAHPAHASTEHPGPPAETLPVTSVSLYKNGVGFFEHTGHVTGNGAVAIDFTSAQLNDVLQSLTAIDLNGGRIAGAGYNSTTPLDQQLRTLPFTLADDASASDFYTAIRGARVSVTGPGGSISGRLLSIEQRSTTTDDTKPTVPHNFITVVSDTGEVRTVELSGATTVHLLDPTLQHSIDRYLQIVADNRSQGLRHLTLTDNGSGTREIRVSYISEVPVWKSTYRILFTPTSGSPTNPGAPGPDSRTWASTNSTGSPTATLQGWSVVDNTTGADWINVHLSLIAGAPQSFIQPLSQPIYTRRPEIPIATEAQLTPQTFDSSIDSIGGNGLHGIVRDPTGASIPNASITATNLETGAQLSGSADSNGNFSIDAPPGSYRVQISSPGFQELVLSNASPGSPLNATLRVGAASETVEVSAAPRMMAQQNYAMKARISSGVMGGMPGYALGAGSGGNIGGGVYHGSYQDLASAAIAPNTTTSAFDDFFSYTLDSPVTILKNQSALVPILQTKIPADSVTLVSYLNGRVSQPLRALWLTNASGLTLDRGSFTVIESGNFAGEGLLDPVHPGEKRLVSYAADQAVHATTEGENTTNRVTAITAAHGIVHLRQTDVHLVTLVLHNAAPTPRTVVSEFPVVAGWELDAASKPIETTATVYRYRTEVDPGATVRLHVGAHHNGENVFYLTQTNESQLAFIVQQSGNSPAVQAALQPILEARRRVADAQAALDQTNRKLTDLRSDEDRQRANITALANADHAARERFVNDLNKTEDAINAAQSELTLRQKALDDAKADLATKIDNLQIDEKVSS